MESYTLPGRNSGDKSNKFFTSISKYVPFCCSERALTGDITLPQNVPSGNHPTYQQILQCFERQCDMWVQ